ncbi:MAG: hypothetical protein J0H78_06485 [Rhizobiales bacterium]|nr:hypothetical protein [Hyphomicrobiales bacterium]
MKMAARVSRLATDWDTGGGRLETMADQSPRDAGAALDDMSIPPAFISSHGMQFSEAGEPCQFMSPYATYRVKTPAQGRRFTRSIADDFRVKAYA